MSHIYSIFFKTIVAHAHSMTTNIISLLSQNDMFPAPLHTISMVLPLTTSRSSCSSENNTTTTTDNNTNNQLQYIYEGGKMIKSCNKLGNHHLPGAKSIEQILPMQILIWEGKVTSMETWKYNLCFTNYAKKDEKKLFQTSTKVMIKKKGYCLPPKQRFFWKYLWIFLGRLTHQWIPRKFSMYNFIEKINRTSQLKFIHNYIKKKKKSGRGTAIWV